MDYKELSKSKSLTSLDVNYIFWFLQMPLGLVFEVIIIFIKFDKK
jgi:uncharacterized integral membrane protein